MKPQQQPVADAPDKRQNCGQETRSAPLYTARVQFISVEAQAAELFAAGHSYRSAWRILTKDHQLTLSYHAFLRNAQKRLPREALPGGTPPQKPSVGGSTDALRTHDLTDQRRDHHQNGRRPPFDYDPARARREDLV